MITTRGQAAARAALVVGLAYAAISVYWAIGGTWLLNTVGISLSRPGQSGHAVALLAVWGAAVLKVIAAILPALAVRLSTKRPDDTRYGLKKPVRVLSWIEAMILTVYGLILTAAGLLIQAGMVKTTANADHLALKWHAYLWDPWFLVWGILVIIALRQSRPARQLLRSR